MNNVKICLHCKTNDCIKYNCHKFCYEYCGNPIHPNYDKLPHYNSIEVKE